MAKKYLNILFITLFSLVSLGSFTAAYLYNKRLVTNENEISEKAYKENEEKTAYTAREVNQFIAILKTLADSLAHKLSKEEIPQEALKKELEKKPIQVSGFGVAYKAKEKGTLEAPYYVQKGNSETLVSLEKFVDYTACGSLWFEKAIEGESLYLGPIKDPVTKEATIIYATPFYDKKKVIQGVVFATQSISHLDYVLSNFYLGQSGYWFLVNNEQQIALHPKNELVNKSIKELALKVNSSDLVSTFTDALHGKVAKTTFDNSLTGNSSWLIAEPLPASGWVLAGVFDKTIPVLGNIYLRHHYLTIILYLLAGLGSLILALLFLGRKRIHYASASLLISLLLALGIMSLWWVANRYPEYDETIKPIKDKASLYDMLDKFKEEKKPEVKDDKKKEIKKDPLLDWISSRHKKGELYVPTGFLINDFNFVSHGQIEIVGFIWQRYYDGIHDKLERGFTFPQLADTPSINIITDEKLGNTQVIVWQVRAKLNQNIIFKSYPFDIKNLKIELWHKNFEKNVILVPDFDSYNTINPSALPGINKEMRLSGWRITSSYFGFVTKPYQTNFGFYKHGLFGIQETVSHIERPELTFNATAQRKLADTLTTDFITILIILILIFIILLSYHRVAFGSIISASTVIFFSTILAQSRLQGKVPTTEFVYFESLYFIIYVALTAVLLLITLYSLKSEEEQKAHKHLFLQRLLYWPLILSSFLGITIMYLF